MLKEAIIQLTEKIISWPEKKRKEKRDKKVREMIEAEALERVWKVLKTIPKETMDFDVRRRDYFLDSHGRKLQIFFRHGVITKMWVIEYGETGDQKDFRVLSFDLKITLHNRDTMEKVIKYRDEALSLRRKIQERNDLARIKSLLR